MFNSVVQVVQVEVVVLVLVVVVVVVVAAAAAAVLVLLVASLVVVIAEQSVLVSGCFKPSQPQRIISGLKAGWLVS